VIYEQNAKLEKEEKGSDFGGFQSLELDDKHNNCQSQICDFHCVATYLEG
jgi:hypothetical protein